MSDPEPADIWLWHALARADEAHIAKREAAQEHRNTGSHILEIAKGYVPDQANLQYAETNLSETA